MSSSVSAGEVQAQVESLERRGESVVILRLRPVDAPFAYTEGQYLSISVPGTAERRSYSMASRCHPDGAIDLHIRLHKDGLFSRMLREQIGAGSSLTFSGPYGNCVWSVPDTEAATVILLATGTGIAPLKAMVERHLPDAARNDVWLYWGAETPDDFYVADELQSLEQAFPYFHFIPVVRSENERWTGSKGFVQDVAASAHPDLRNAYVFACGAPAMIRSARDLLVSRNHLLADRYFFDAFEPSMFPRAASLNPYSVSSVAVVVSMPDQSVRSVRCPVGASLMLSLVSKNIIHAICGGNQSCGTCRVTIEGSAISRLPEITKSERRLLRALPDSGPFDRLSCQLNVAPEHEGMHITIPCGMFDQIVTSE
ncbi:2Fe-2S iron-sulfur cluster binding domain-containing protein [Paraburkholderia sprentiae WSM5005]|uniref:2Fe-2S iron-sulfur cluster binding domain-containing protein n=1 Tax=Paraburkholderia sprentiae WSM5005 TaxID=754502 RepID=A0A8F4KHX2_9BURK|nr:FAD-binding oxidoreductase [Paraburkholderia sprentiae]QXE07184.1 2Fe-2S iron-sulfur cluster binding domain-containing protein [Paraburkholderia sprentiae WSM5005]